jgi:hypothetical protein
MEQDLNNQELRNARMMNRHLSTAGQSARNANSTKLLENRSKNYKMKKILDIGYVSNRELL